MKKLYTLAILFFASSAMFAQTPVELKLHHKLGLDDFAYGVEASNNLGHVYKTTRLEYYVSQITIVHDGGTETSVPLDTIDLVQPGTETSTTIALGSYSVTTIEGVKFYIGVHTPTNNEDPSLYSTDHPLGPKSPSMHWGWTAGYRFVAYEGDGGVGFTQEFQLHGLGNANYFEVSANVDVVDESGTLVMNLMANYEEGVRDIDLDAGTISHGETGEAKQTLENWRDFVFGNYYASNPEYKNEVSWTAYPSPSTGEVNISMDGTALSKGTLKVVNSLGQNVQSIPVEDNGDIYKILLNEPGVYFLNIETENGESLSSKRVVIQ